MGKAPFLGMNLINYGSARERPNSGGTNGPPARRGATCPSGVERPKGRGGRATAATADMGRSCFFALAPRGSMNILTQKGGLAVLSAANYEHSGSVAAFPWRSERRPNSGKTAVKRHQIRP